MSTPEQQPGDPLMRRYREGLPPRNPAEVAAYREWHTLDAQYEGDALAARALVDAYQSYDGPLNSKAWNAERRRSEELARLGIEHPLLPDRYANALGNERAWRLERQVEDRFLEIERSDPPPSHDELSAQARQFGAAARALNEGVARRVAELEDRQAAYVEELVEVDRRGDVLHDFLEQRAEAAGYEDIHELIQATGYEDIRADFEDYERVEAKATELREGLRSVDQELDALAQDPDHPDRWREQEGERCVQALAAMQHFRRERALDRTAPEPASELNNTAQMSRGQEGHEATPAARGLDADGAGLDPF